MHSTSDRFQENLCIEILKTIASLDDEIILDIWNFSISNLVALWCVCGNNDDSDDDVEKRNNFIRTIINRSMEIVVPDLKFSFTIKLCDLFILACLKSTYSYVKNEKRTIAPSIIIEVLEAIIRILQSTNEVWSDELINKISSVQCYVTNDDQILSSVLMNFGPINYVNLWQEKVVRKLHELTENVNKYERISSDIRVVNSRQGGYEGLYSETETSKRGKLSFNIPEEF